jgi:hypothetical protein
MCALTAAAVAFAAASTALVSTAAAYTYYTPYPPDTFSDSISAGVTDSDLSNQISFTLLHDGINSETIVGGPALRALKSRLASLGKSYLRILVEDTKSLGGAPIEYIVSLDGEFFSGISPAPAAGAVEADGNGINVALNFILDSTKKLITITGNVNGSGNGYYDKTLSYTLEYNHAMTLLGNAGISAAKKLRWFYINGSGDEVTTNITNAGTDQHFYMDANTFGGLYVTAYDPEAEKYYSYEESDPLIKQALADAFGMDPAADSLADIADAIKAEIDGNYLSQADIDNYITKYFYDNTADGKDHRKKLAELLMTENRDQVVDALYEVFGDGTTTRQETAILEHIWDELEAKVGDEVEDRLLTIVQNPDKYDTSYLFYVAKELFDYNIKQWSEDNFRTLQILIDDLKANYPNLTLAEILDKIGYTKTDTVRDLIREALEQALGYNSVQYTYQSIRERLEDAIKTAVDDINASLSVYATRDEMIAAIPAAVAAYFAANAEKFKGDTGMSAYEVAVSNGFTGTPEEWLASLSGAPGKSAYELAVEHGYTGTELQWLRSLVGADGYDGMDGADGKDGKDGKDGRDGVDGRDGQNFTEWAIQTYGSVEGFIASVVNEVLRNVKDGDSAYEIAVQNGFRGSEQEWLNSLVGESAYDIAIRNGYRGSEDEWLESLRGRDGQDGEDGKDGKDGRDGRDGQIIYMDSYAPNAARAGEVIDQDDPDDSGEEEIAILDNYQPENYSGVVAGQTANPNARSANPATGAAAGIIIPAAAVGALLLVKKDKRKRGRK